MTVVLFTIPLITRLLANTNKKLQTASFYSVFVTIHSVFQQRNIVHQTDDTDVEQNILQNTSDDPDDQSVEVTRSTRCSFCVQIVSILFYLINVSVVQNFGPFLCFSLFFFSWPVTTTQPTQELKSLYFPKLLKLMWSSSILVALEKVFLIWGRLQISWCRFETEYAAVMSDRITCGAPSDTKYVNQRQKGHFPWRRSNMLSNGQLYENNCEWSILQH